MQIHLYRADMLRYYHKGCRASQGGSPMGTHAIECNGDKTTFQWRMLDQCGNQSKFATLEAFFISTLKPAKSTRETNTEQEN